MALYLKKTLKVVFYILTSIVLLFSIGCPGATGGTTTTVAPTTTTTITGTTNPADTSSSTSTTTTTTESTIPDTTTSTTATTTEPTTTTTYVSTTTVALTTTTTSTSTTTTTTLQTMQIKQDAVIIDNNTGIYDYGLQTNGVAKEITFTIVNNGPVSISLTGSPRVAISGTDAVDFVVTAQPLSTVAAGSSNITFKITFTPSSLGAKSATVSIDNSSTDYNLYTFGLTGTGVEQVATPSFTPNGGTDLTTTQSVTIECATSGATIRYTTDGSAPSQTVGTVYSGAISVDKTTTVKAIAYKVGMADSDIGSAAFIFPVVFAMIDVPTTGITFNFNDTKLVELSPFKMANTETSYGLWSEVYDWAVLNSYTFANAGSPGYNGTNGANEPVVNVNWRDCIVWCNAYSEKNALTPVYYTDSGFTTPLRVSTGNGTVDTTPGSEDNPYINWSATGYRLPTEAEWEYAARYIDGTNWTPTTYMSGATADYNDAAASQEVAWYNDNSGSATHEVGTKRANALGLYDMSGNLWEWNWDWYGSLTSDSEMDPRGAATGSFRLIRGGSFLYGADNCRTGNRIDYHPWSYAADIGFRIVCLSN